MYICTVIDRILSSTSCLLQLIAFSWIVFPVCKVCTLEDEFITCTIFLLWSWQEIEKFDNTKRVIRIRKSKKSRQHNGQKKKDKRTNNDDLQGKLRCTGRVSNSCSTSGTRRVNLVTNLVISNKWGKAWNISVANCDTEVMTST
jgi:hypothetical protein